LQVIGSGLAAFITAQLNRIQERPQLKMLSRCAMSIGALDPTAISAAAMSMVQTRLNGSDAGIVDIPVIAAYKRLYATENTLNSQFNRFATHLLKAYGGANKISVQLIHFSGDAAEGRVYVHQSQDAQHYFPSLSFTHASSCNSEATHALTHACADTDRCLTTACTASPRATMRRCR